MARSVSVELLVSPSVSVKVANLFRCTAAAALLAMVA